MFAEGFELSLGVRGSGGVVSWGLAVGSVGEEGGGGEGALEEGLG